MKKQELREALKQTPAMGQRLFNSSFGLRMQALRVLTTGRASKYGYPEGLEDRETNPYLTSGYSDNTMEFNGIIVKGAKSAVRQLAVLQQIVDSHLSAEERLWPLSLAPTAVYLHDMDYLSSNCTRADFTDFSHRLTQKYGEIRSLMAGVHVGYSVDHKLVQWIYDNFGKDQYEDEAAFRNDLYFKLGQHYVLWQWLFTYLFGASPVAPMCKDVVAPKLDHQIRSLRNSSMGYGNLPDEQVNYASFDQYEQSLNQFLQDGTYQNIQEFQGPVCLHNRTDDLKQGGATYLSLRMFDLDPFAPTGMSEDTLNFVELVMVHSLLSDSQEYSQDDLQKAIARNQEVAMQDPLEQPEWLKEAATKLTDELDKFCDEYDAPRQYRMALKFVQRRIEDPSLTIAGQMVANTESGNFMSFGLKLANDRFTMQVQSGQPLEVMGKVCSKSIQNMIKAAIVSGVEVEYENHQVLFRYKDETKSIEPTLEMEMPHGPLGELQRMFPQLAAD